MERPQFSNLLSEATYFQQNLVITFFLVDFALSRPTFFYQAYFLGGPQFRPPAWSRDETS